MATLRPYKCIDCGLMANISGGPDRLFSGSTSTCYCQKCEALYDILTPLELAFIDSSPDKKCPNCHSTQLVVWSNNEPCPRCGGNLEIDASNNFIIDAD